MLRERINLDNRTTSKSFPISRRGYETAEVDTYLETLEAEYRAAEEEYLEAIRIAQDEARRASAKVAPSSSVAFENVGYQVAAILGSAAQVADEMKQVAEREAEAAVSAATADADKMLKLASDELARAKQARSTGERQADSLLAAARSNADELLDEAHSAAITITQDAKEAAARLERIARANVEAIVTEGRREYQRLRALQQQSIDRLTSVEFLVRQARDGLSNEANLDLISASADTMDSSLAVSGTLVQPGSGLPDEGRKTRGSRGSSRRQGHESAE